MCANTMFVLNSQVKSDLLTLVLSIVLAKLYEQLVRFDWVFTREYEIRELISVLSGAPLVVLFLETRYQSPHGSFHNGTK